MHRDDDKKRSQVAFLSETLQVELQVLAEWLGERNLILRGRTDDFIVMSVS
jgi:hypothetical protein